MMVPSQRQIGAEMPQFSSRMVGGACFIKCYGRLDDEKDTPIRCIFPSPRSSGGRMRSVI
jgi:hypothetical protein